ncbi:hypothetical protein FNV43_RR24301 [Rhamnella rubrinervis]|uniref:C3H1-type domain-containing protein n=1 Tax=Rhamnella rubrinervis TaxID=2594499 RepID=A0A8K0DRZ7_9ROSA|nr:hypothetical protein FNV43_RR24301 [Rhamnella rubrinervis]
MFHGIDPVGFYEFPNHHQYPGLTVEEYNARIDEAIYGSDEFRMFAYKIKRCPRTRSHDWTECPYAHRGEKATRRDPRKFNYSAIVCPAYRTGKCNRGDFCEFAHGVFEYWLHPARYRTRACNSGVLCQRKVCFFAHSPEQLRPERKVKPLFACRRQLVDGMNGGDCATNIPQMISDGERITSSQQTEMVNNNSLEKLAEFLKSLKALKIKEEEEKSASGLDYGLSESDLVPHIAWISELLQ